jgi:hypothetical protein
MDVKFRYITLHHITPSSCFYEKYEKNTKIMRYFATRQPSISNIVCSYLSGAESCSAAVAVESSG